MVDKQLPTVASNGTTVNGGSDAEDAALLPGEMDIPENLGPEDAAPLLLRIRRDRIDVQQRLTRVKEYIARTTTAMINMKDKEDMRAQYNRLSAARADLVRNAVSLQQLFVRLHTSEMRAAHLAGDAGTASVSEIAEGTVSDIDSAPAVLPPRQDSGQTGNQSFNDCSPEELARMTNRERERYQRRQDLIRQVQATEQSTRQMETERQDLEVVRENLENRITETRSARIQLERRAEQLGRDSGLRDSDIATSEDADHPDQQDLQQHNEFSSLNGRLAALRSVPLEAMDGESAGELRQRLEGLSQFRSQMDELIVQMEQLKSRRIAARDTAGTESTSSNPEVSDGTDLTSIVVPDVGEQLAPSIVGEQTFTQGDPPMVQPDATLLEHKKEVEMLTNSCQHKQRELAEARQQLSRMLQLSGQLQEHSDRGDRLSTAAPQQLTEFIAGSCDQGQLSTSDQQLDAHADAERVVQTLQRVQESVDVIRSMPPPPE